MDCKTPDRSQRYVELSPACSPADAGTITSSARKGNQKDLVIKTDKVVRRGIYSGGRRSVNSCSRAQVTRIFDDDTDSPTHKNVLSMPMSLPARFRIGSIDDIGDRERTLGSEMMSPLAPQNLGVDLLDLQPSEGTEGYEESKQTSTFLSDCVWQKLDSLDKRMSAIEVKFVEFQAHVSEKLGERRDQEQRARQEFTQSFLSALESHVKAIKEPEGTIHERKGGTVSRLAEASGSLETANILADVQKCAARAADLLKVHPPTDYFDRHIEIHEDLEEKLKELGAEVSKHLIGKWDLPRVEKHKELDEKAILCESSIAENQRNLSHNTLWPEHKPCHAHLDAVASTLRGKEDVGYEIPATPREPTSEHAREEDIAMEAPGLRFPTHATI
mmetsp:Transcript_155585/g.290353  ORF Transcript_155585/g.290353 Transcript_155585/m.290353 type:complete len:388 (-) Transcript_155585:128-1291(-)